MINGLDIVLMNYANETSHLGLLTDDNTIIHSTMERGKVVEDKLSSSAGKRILMCFRYKGFNNG